MTPGAERSSRVRFGLIGAGRWGDMHRRSLADTAADLTAVLVASESSRVRVERDWGVAAHTDLDAFLASELDAVIVASPNYLHGEQATAALGSGRHVLVEKPMATTLEACDRMLAAARDTGRVLAVGLEMRVFTLFSTVKELLDQGEIGTPLHLRLDLWRRPYRTGASGWKSDPAKLGSSILEEPIHYLDLTRWYLADALGEPSGVQAWATSRAGREGYWDNLDVRLSFGGAQALVTRSIAAFEHHVTLDVVGEEGALRARWDGLMDTDPHPSASVTLHNLAGTKAIEVPQHTGHGFDVPKQTLAFLGAIRGEAPPPADGEDGRAAVALCLAVERSLGEGSRLVALEPPRGRENASG